METVIILRCLCCSSDYM